ncbi:hypothetical protein PC116_g24178 [Phytophthora cactorum]|uniref:Uncharacterized protein n=1 Tax=Phytophthora cactorum TaxID=29920 RepID=A0A8T1JU06_9STRA|nr:hypothetical protein PC113_g15248 [Phytophthora cactorum]KAG2880410.1 hypothetical protein PC114_g22096 [Phytophthora cactorum]KAG2995631.1 hypothetical protein PC119_g18019 [Phytophthora cactorum]KAG4227437.1 hypothetical protein PC116_g24178 [Phytophthora cactorum]
MLNPIEGCFSVFKAKVKAFLAAHRQRAPILVSRRNCPALIQTNVLRLIDGSSNELELWNGVSVLFSSSHDAAKFKGLCQTYVLPVWTLEELKEYNALLSDDLKLQEDELEARFYKFGGIAKTIFAKNQQAKGIDFKSAIEFYDALTVVNYVQTHRVVREEDEIHQLLQMVPSKDSFRESSYLTLVSDYVVKSSSIRQRVTIW